MSKFLGVIAGVTAATVSFEGNDAGIKGDFRHTSLSRFSLGWDATFYSSIAGKVEGNKVVDQDTYTAGADGKIQANAVFAALATGPKVFPQMYLANFEFQADASADAVAEINQEKETLTGTGMATADFSSSAGFVAHSAVDIQEIDAEGEVVETWSLAGSLLPLGGLQWEVGAIVNGVEDTIHSSEHIGKWADQSLTITMIASDRAGQVSSGGLLTPSSVELTYDFKGKALKDAANHLRLRMGVASANALARATANGVVNGAVSSGVIQRIASGSDNDAVWVDFAKTAVVSDKTVDVEVAVTSFTDATATADASVTGEAAVDLLGNLAGAFAKGAASGSGSAGASVNMVTVDFPAGVTAFFYDPTVGAGETPDPKMTSSATALSFSIVFSVVAALL